jgi:hypothetical protein
MDNNMQLRTREFLQICDEGDVDAALSFFTPGAVVRTPDTAPVIGRSALRRTILPCFANLLNIHHEPLLLWAHDPLCIAECDVTLTRADHAIVCVPVTYVVRWTDKLISDLQINWYVAPFTYPVGLPGWGGLARTAHA